MQLKKNLTINFAIILFLKTQNLVLMRLNPHFQIKYQIVCKAIM